MKCQIAERKLSAYSDMELAEEQRVELEKDCLYKVFHTLGKRI